MKREVFTTLVLVVAVFSGGIFHFYPGTTKKSPVTVEKPSVTVLEMYQEFYTLQCDRDAATAEWNKKEEFYYDALKKHKVKLKANPDDINILRKWVRLLKEKKAVNRRWLYTVMPIDKRQEKICSKLEELGEPPPK